MKFTNVSLKFPIPDVTEYTAKVRSFIKEETLKSARVFIEAVDPYVPTYTGMSRGALQAIAEQVGATVYIIPRVPPEGHRPDYPRTIGAGRMRGHVKQHHGTHSSKITFKISVAHFVMNELFVADPRIQLTHKTPWHSFNAGIYAWLKYVRVNVIPKFPRLRTRIQVAHNVVKNI